jgi:hypothetical protein
MKRCAILFGLLLSSCAPASGVNGSATHAIETYVAQATATLVPPAATITPTSAPSPTLTAFPPTPTLVPPAPLTEFLHDVVITWTDKLDNMQRWQIWNSPIKEASNGVLEIQGQPDWTGVLEQRTRLSEGMGITMEFQNVLGAEYAFFVESGQWQTDSYRDFGIFGGNTPMAELWQGKNNLGSKYLRGNLSVTRNAWYGVAIAIGKDAEFFALIWSVDDPGHNAMYHETLNDKWRGIPWKYMVQANSGTVLNVRNPSLFSFGTVK